MASSALIILILVSCFISTSFSLRVISDRASNTKPEGFSAPLIHRDSPQSPFYDAKLTRTDRLRAAIQRSFNRYNHYTSNIVVPNNMRAALSYRDSEYVISHHIGTPPVQTYSIVDTGSDLTWLQCRPCDNCYDQEIPIYDPQKSSSYAKVGCEDDICKPANDVSCDKAGTFCRYSLDYVDTGHSEGVLSSETFIFQEDSSYGNISLLELPFGCGHNNSFPYKVGVPGVVGLSRDPLSWISQLSWDHFSHCLVPKSWNKTSLLRFGKDAFITIHTTPLLDIGNSTPGSYYVGLEGISVGRTKLDIPKGTFDVSAKGEGGVIIDTGTAYTHLIAGAYDPLVEELENQVELETVVVKNETMSFDLCYKAKPRDRISLPDLTFHFKDESLVVLKWNVWEDVGDGSVCFTMFKAYDMTLIGAQHLQNVNVGYDLRKKMISLNIKDCTDT